MRKYYIYIDGKEEGAFSIEDLKERKIGRDTMVWFNGLDKWLKAEHVEELKQLFEALPPKLTSPPPFITPPTPERTLPPPFTGTNNVQNEVSIPKNNRNIYWIIGLLLLSLFGFGVWYFMAQSSPILSSNGDRVNIRQFPDINAPVLYQLNRSEKVVYLNEKSSFRTNVIVNGIERNNFWYKVKTIGNVNFVGWVHGDFLNLPSNFSK